MTLFAQSNPFQMSFVGDTGVYIYIAKEILEGRMPYRDVFDHKGPLIYLFDALGLLINDKFGIWLVELIFIFVTFLFAYKIARLLKCNRLSSCIVVTIGIFALLNYFQGGNLTEEYACVFITASLYYFLYFFINGTIEKLQIALTGISFAAVCMLRANMIACWIVMFSGVLIECVKFKRSQFTVRLVGWFLTGALFVFVPILAWLFFNDSLKPFIEDYIIFNFIYSSSTLTSSKFEAFLAFITTLPMLLSVLVLSYFCVKQNKQEDWLCMTALLLSVVLASMSGRQYGHYGMVFYPFIIYVISRLFNEALSSVVKTSFYVKYELVLFLLLCCILGCIFFLTRSMFFAGYLNSLVNPLKNDYIERKRISDIVKSVTEKDDKISVVGNENSLYLLSNRKSASKYSYQFPIVDAEYDIWKEYFNEIRKSSVKVIVLMPVVDNKYPYSEIKMITDKCYRLIAVVSQAKVFLLKTQCK